MPSSGPPGGWWRCAGKARRVAVGKVSRKVSRRMDQLRVLGIPCGHGGHDLWSSRQIGWPSGAKCLSGHYHPSCPCAATTNRWSSTITSPARATPVPPVGGNPYFNPTLVCAVSREVADRSEVLPTKRVFDSAALEISSGAWRALNVAQPPRKFASTLPRWQRQFAQRPAGRRA